MMVKYSKRLDGKYVVTINLNIDENHRSVSQYRLNKKTNENNSRQKTLRHIKGKTVKPLDTKGNIHHGQRINVSSDTVDVKSMTQKNRSDYRITKGRQRVQLRVKYHQAKTDEKVLRYQLKKAKVTHRKLKRKGKDVLAIKAKRQQIQQQLHQARTRKFQLKKKIYHKRFRYVIRSTASQLGTQLSNSILQQDDTLQVIVSARHKYQSMQASSVTIKRTSKRAYRIGQGLGKISYGLANRTYNVFRGRGFRRTPAMFSWQAQLKKQLKLRLAKIKWLKHVKPLKNQVLPLFYPLTRFTKNLLRNPVSLYGLLNLFGVLMILSPFISSGVIKQKEFDMTDTWVYLTKLDREHSNDTVKYWSDIDDMLFYMNYRYDHIRKQYPIDTHHSMPDGVMGKNYLNWLWDKLNKDVNHLKTMKDLYTAEGDYHLTTKELEDYNNRLLLADQLGKYVQMNDLSNFFMSKTDKATKPLKIVERHGYRSRETLVDSSTFKAEPGAYLYAAMAGKVTVTDTTVVIENDKRRLTYFDVDHIRVSTGQELRTGDMIGQVDGRGNQVMKYEKPRKDKNGEKDDKGKVKITWQAVNIGFYLPNVTYTQKTSVIKKTSLSSDKAQRVRAFVTSIKQFFPNATNEGLAALFGNFDVESGINPKIAEGDHLQPPVGKTDDSSYDDPNWLNIGGVAIYGRYPNIIHRGIGLGQWTDTADGSTRQTLLRQYADVKGKKWYDLDLQVDFMVNGDTPYYKQILNEVIHSTEDVGVLTERFLDKWEGNPGDKVDQRMALAKEWYAFLTQGAAGQPLANMNDVVVTSYFGEVRVGLVSHDGRVMSNVHNGIDLVYRDGRSHAPIYAVDAGEVISSGDSGLGGLTVIIKHANYYSYYLHLSSIHVAHGQHVQAGDVIGAMGNTGFSTGEHLHFGLSRQLGSEFYDPKPYLQLP